MTTRAPKVLWRTTGIALGVLMALGISGIIGNRLPRGDGPIISECSGGLNEIVIQYVSGSDAVVPVYRDFLRQLDARVTVDVVCPDQKSFDEFQSLMPSRDYHLRIVDHEMSVWSRDRWIALAGERVKLVAPRGEDSAENWPARKGDQQLAFDLAKLDPAHSIDAQRSGLYFEGGDFLADESRVFVTPAVVRANLQRTVQSIDELSSQLEQLLGKPVVMLKDAPPHHAGMFMMAAGNNVMLVGDPKLGRGEPAPAMPGGVDDSESTQRKFDAVANQMTELGYRVIRIPTVDANDGRSYLTYVNVITDHRDGRHIVYLPQFRGAESLNDRAAEAWRSIGYEVRPVDCTSTFRLFGNLHCLVNVVRRT